MTIKKKTLKKTKTKQKPKIVKNKGLSEMEKLAEAHTEEIIRHTDHLHRLETELIYQSKEINRIKNITDNKIVDLKFELGEVKEIWTQAIRYSFKQQNMPKSFFLPIKKFFSNLIESVTKLLS